MVLRLHNFFRSGTSHRLRIALNLKGLPYDYVPVNLPKLEHQSAAYKAIQPQGLVPALVDGDTVLIQSPAIIEWLEETHPAPPLLPSDPLSRARVRALAAIVGCDIHPLNNRRVLETLRHSLSCDEPAVIRWCEAWIAEGFDAYETLLAADSQRSAGFSRGNAPTLADLYLVPQVESARRFKVDITRWPRIAEIDATCGRLEAFARAAPALQPDAT